MHEIDGKRMNRYHELGQYAFGKSSQSAAPLRASDTVCLAYVVRAGKTAGLWAIIPFQLIVMIGLGRFPPPPWRFPPDFPCSKRHGRCHLSHTRCCYIPYEYCHTSDKHFFSVLQDLCVKVAAVGA